MENQNLERIFLEDDKKQRYAIYWRGFFMAFLIIDAVLALAVLSSIVFIK